MCNEFFLVKEMYKSISLQVDKGLISNDILYMRGHTFFVLYVNNIRFYLYNGALLIFY